MATAVLPYPSAETVYIPRTTAAADYLVHGNLLRAAGAIAVILVHVAHEGTRVTTWIGTPPWWWCATFDAMGRWAVPVFLMLSGAIFLHHSRSEPAAVFYRKRLLRIGIPMVFWSVFFLGWYIFFQQPAWGMPALTWPDAFDLLLSGARPRTCTISALPWGSTCSPPCSVSTPVTQRTGNSAGPPP